MKSIDWFITNKCKSKHCPFCYAPVGFPSESSFEKKMLICEKIVNENIDVVTLCGGEPLLSEGIVEVVRFLHVNGVKVNLTTGLAGCGAKLEPIIQYLSMLSLPIDACSDDRVHALRGTEVHASVISTLESLYIKKARPKVKIGTVVNSLNIDEITNIFEVIYRYHNIVDVWRLYMFSPYLKQQNREKLAIDEREFWNVIESIHKLSEERQLRTHISTRSKAENKGYCYIMDSDGGFYKYDEEYHFLNVSIFNGFDVVVMKYNAEQNRKQKKWQELAFCDYNNTDYDLNKQIKIQV